MSTTYGANTGIQNPAVGDRNWHTPLLANHTLLDQMGSLGPLCVTLTETPSTTLNVKVAAGSVINPDGSISTFAGSASQAITTASTRYVYLNAAGTLTVGSAWPTAASYTPLAVVVAGATTITSIADARICFPRVNAGTVGGRDTLVGGTKVVTNSNVTATSNIQLTSQVDGGTPGWLRVSARTAGTSFTVTSSSGSDTSTFAYVIIEP